MPIVHALDLIGYILRVAWEIYCLWVLICFIVLLAFLLLPTKGNR